MFDWSLKRRARAFRPAWLPPYRAARSRGLSVAYGDRDSRWSERLGEDTARD